MATSNDLQEQVQALRLSDADLQEESNIRMTDGGSTTTTTTTATTTTTTTTTTAARPFRFIPLKMGGNGRTHVPCKESRALIKKEVSLEDLTKMTEAFYDKAFQDQTLDRFIRSHQDPHASRFAKWIHQKLSDSNVWDQDRQYHRDLTPVKLAGNRTIVVHDRSSAHAAAWHSPKREKQKVGRHFNLEECRVWMRLHFWALRESGLLEQSPSFANYYVRFIGHFVRVYESTAPTFARDSFRWSENPTNLQTYLDNQCRMTDVLGLSWRQAIEQIPIEEANDTVWPYNTTPTTRDD